MPLAVSYLEVSGESREYKCCLKLNSMQAAIPKSPSLIKL